MTAIKSSTPTNNRKTAKHPSTKEKLEYKKTTKCSEGHKPKDSQRLRPHAGKNAKQRDEKESPDLPIIVDEEKKETRPKPSEHSFEDPDEFMKKVVFQSFFA
jgi:hypothetical protein